MKNNPIKYLLKDLLSLFLVFWIGISTCLLLPYDKQFGYNQLLESCNKREWLYHRIFLNKNPIDIILLGSSQMLCGIQDSLLEEKLIAKNEKYFRTANLSFCRYGRPLHYAILKDVLKKHNPHHLVLEVRERESRFNHPSFHFIADDKDLLEVHFHQSYLKCVINGASTRVNYQLNKTFSTLLLNNYNEQEKDHCNMTMPNIANVLTLKDKKEARQNKGQKGNGFSWQYRFSKQYLNKIAALGKSSEVKISFLYLPSYGSAFDQPIESELYKSLGQLLIPPKFILDDPSNWADDVHLNATGSELLTHWLADIFLNKQTQYD